MVQIGIRRHRQRARNGRGGHDQLMRDRLARSALVAQSKPLVHAETMLFVDDGQGQIVEGHRLLHQRVRADHHLRRAGSHIGQHAGTRFAGDLAGQPGHADAQRFQPLAQVGQVLLGQQFGRGGERGLLARFHREHGCHRRDHGLAAAHVALHQPHHWRGLRQVMADLREHALLRTGQRKR
jgi:hypothetical protein